ncbi:hypothetical protein BU26DRAFT_455728, partial [Trematosphaeria pertusa]
MRQRFQMVDETHYQTFRWILEEGMDNDSQRLSDARKLFTDWLADGDGIFHIAGKLGSGKSTLMKFLRDHPRTKADLRKWAGNRKLVLASFFFWRPGSSLQKSLKGLRRSLLHDLLQAIPGLVRVVFPRQWQQAALQTVIQYRDLHNSHRFCFFLDALDEYEGPPQQDCKEMLDSIKFWISASRGAVKICVSSREDNVFENSFPPEKRLRLQDLTERDMARYVQDKLQDVQDLEVRGRLVHEIASRSEGIFLWTVLVVKALRECLEESQDLQAFEKELHSLPNELEALFEHLLGSIRRSARERAYRIFAMVSKLNERQAQLPLLSCMFVDEYARNPGFAVETTSRHLEIMGETQDKRHYREVQLARARKLVQGSCKGLVEIRDAKMDTRRLDVKCVMFTHRTIPEFLQRSKIQTEMALHLEGFKLEDGIAQLLLAEIRSTDSVFLNPEYWGKTLFAALAIRCYAGMDMVPYSYLTILEEELKRKNLGPPLDLDARFTYQGMTLVEYGIEVFMTPSVRQQRRPGEAYRFRLSLPSYIYARLGAANYVNWKIRQDPDLVKTEFRKSLLLVCLTKSLYQACFTVQRDATIDCFKLLTV